VRSWFFYSRVVLVGDAPLVAFVAEGGEVNACIFGDAVGKLGGAVEGVG